VPDGVSRELVLSGNETDLGDHGLHPFGIRPCESGLRQHLQRFLRAHIAPNPSPFCAREPAMQYMIDQP